MAGDSYEQEVTGSASLQQHLCGVMGLSPPTLPRPGALHLQVRARPQDPMGLTSGLRDAAPLAAPLRTSWQPSLEGAP